MTQIPKTFLRFMGYFSRLATKQHLTLPVSGDRFISYEMRPQHFLVQLVSFLVSRCWSEGNDKDSTPGQFGEAILETFARGG